MVDTVSIALDNSSYCPGQTISGQVQCVFSKERIIRAVRVTFKGRAKTRWSVKRGKRRTRYTAKEVYFDQTVNLAGGEDEFTHASGRHAYPFSYVLPQELPSSYRESYGNVRYTIKAVVDRPWKFDYEDKHILKIISPLDLNILPGLREPVGLSIDKDLMCCWCRPGLITFKASLPITGFVPDQELNISCYVLNMSNVNVEEVAFRMDKHIEFISHVPSTRRKHKSISVVEPSRAGGIGAHAEKTWTSSLKIPTNVAFENVRSCSIINISYIVQVTLVLPFQYQNMSIEFPITIGTVPLVEVGTTLPGSPPLQINSTGVSNDNSYPSAPPPSYSEVWVRRDLVENSDRQ